MKQIKAKVFSTCSACGHTQVVEPVEADEVMCSDEGCDCSDHLDKMRKASYQSALQANMEKK